MGLSRKLDLVAAKASAPQKALTRGRQAGSPAKTMMSIALVAATVLGVMVYGYVVFGVKKVEANETTPSDERFRAAALEARVPPIPTPATKIVRVEAPLEVPKDEPAAPAPASSAAEPREEPKAFDWKPVLARSSGSIVVSRPAPAREVLTGAASPVLRPRHIPRGTELLAVLESRIVSDLKDGRVRARLLEDFRLKGDLIFPEGTTFIGDVTGVEDRWQKRVEVRITNAILDGEQEAVFNGILMDVDDSTHLPADDVKYHTFKASLAVAGLAALGAVADYSGAARNNLPLAVAGGNTAKGLGELAEHRLERVLDRPPTLVVESGRLVKIFVDESFDLARFDPAGRYQMAAVTAATGGAAPPVPSGLDPALAAQLSQLSQMEERMAALIELSKAEGRKQ